MSVLIGITTKNRCEILPKAIASALDQDYIPLSVTVFDDFSEDHTGMIKNQFPMVNWETASETKGYLYARNKMMKESSAYYFCSLDDDAWFLSRDSINLAVHYLEDHPTVAAIAFDIVSPDLPVIKKVESPYETGIFIGCGHLLRLSAIREVGYYDIFPCSYGVEEKDLCLKLINAGYSIVFMPGVHVWHDKTNVQRDEKFQHLSGICNDLTFTYRRSPLLILIPGILLKIIKHFRFSITYDNGSLFPSFIKGVNKFLAHLFGFKLQRSPVRLSAFRKFYKFRGV